MEKTVVLDMEVLDKVVRYLATKPYAEVAELMSALSMSIRANSELKED